MNVTRQLVKLYPAPLRERWGSGLEAEAQAEGWRSWPSLVVGILDMWLHPVVWPTDSAAQRRRRAAALAFAVGVGGWLLGHVAVEDSMLPPSVRHSWSLDVSDGLVLLGLVLVAPLPRLTLGAVVQLLGQVVRRLAIPLLVGAIVVMRANLSGEVSPGLKPVLLICWWLALVVGAIQVCHVVAGLGADVVVPAQPLRLRLGIWALAAAFAIAGSIVSVAAVADGATEPLSAAVGVALLAPSIMCGGTLRDLATLPPG